MEYTLDPSSFSVRFELEDRAHSVGAAGWRRAVEIAGCVEDQATAGTCSVAPVERMEDALDPASIPVRRELENRALSEGAATGSRAVEIPGCVDDQARVGQVSAESGRLELM